MAKYSVTELFLALAFVGSMSLAVEVCTTFALVCQGIVLKDVKIPTRRSIIYSILIIVY